MQVDWAEYTGEVLDAGNPPPETTLKPYQPGTDVAPSPTPVPPGTKKVTIQTPSGGKYVKTIEVGRDPTGWPVLVLLGVFLFAAACGWMARHFSQASSS